MMRCSFVFSHRVLHNIVANGRILFVDCVGLPETEPLALIDVGEVFPDDKKHFIRVCSPADLKHVEQIAAKKMSVLVIGDDNAGMIVEGLTKLGHLQLFIVREQLARSFFLRVPVLQSPHFDLPHLIL